MGIFPLPGHRTARRFCSSSDRNGTLEIFKQAIDEPLAESVVAGPDQMILPRLSPDGSEILYISGPSQASPDTPCAIFAIPIRGGAPRLVLKDVGIWNVQCARLPSTVCLYSIPQGKQMKTFRFDVRNGQTADLPSTRTLVTIGAYLPMAQNERLPFSILTKGGFNFAPHRQAKRVNFVVSGWSGFATIDWSADGKSLLVVSSNHAGETTLLNVRLDGSVSILMSGSNPRSQVCHSITGRTIFWRSAKRPVPAMCGWSTILDPMISTEPEDHHPGNLNHLYAEVSILQSRARRLAGNSI